MRDIKGLEEKIKNLLDQIQISDEKLRLEWLLLAEMHYRTDGCYREDGSTMSDDEFMREWEKKCPLDEFIAEQRQRRLDPFGGPKEEPAKRKRSRHEHHDFSDR